MHIQNARWLRAALLPELIYVAVLPYVIYRLASPHMPAAYALLLAGIPPAVRTLLGLAHHGRINLFGVFSLLAIAIKIISGLVLQDTRLILISSSLVTGAYGVIMLASLLSPTPLILKFIMNARAGSDPTQWELLTKRWQEAGSRSIFALITAIWGVGLLIELLVRITLVFTLTVDQFLAIGPIVQYSFLGVMLLATLLFLRIRRSRKRKLLEQLSQQPMQEISHT